MSFFKEICGFYRQKSDQYSRSYKSWPKRCVLSRRILLKTGLTLGALELFLPAKLLAVAREDTEQDNYKHKKSKDSEFHNMFNLALKHEHGAIVQYANHAGLMSAKLGGAHTETIQSIINDEVRHSIILVRELKKVGLNPTLAVWPPKTAINAPEMLSQDIAAEQGAVDLYGRILSLGLNKNLAAKIEAMQKAEKEHKDLFSNILVELNQGE